ncbi:MAG: aminoacyl-tRNA hydrolase [Candidatus Magasanikbacteria bacterium]
MNLIVGLGNPGKKYKKTRHNIGFMVLDKIHEKLQIRDISDWSLSEKFNAEVSGCHIDGEKNIFAKPMTYMNKSGQAVQMIGDYYSLTSEDLIVVHDDIDIELGEIKTQKNISSAGHKGVNSIINHINTKNFRRVRVGIKTDKLKDMEVSDFVLSKFGWFESGTLKKVKDDAADQVLDLINK